MWAAVAAGAVLVCAAVVAALCLREEKVPQAYIDLWDSNQNYAEKDFQTIQVSGDVRILQLTDIHYDNTNNRKEDTLALIRQMITATGPDMIAVTGDWCSNASDREANARAVFDCIDSFGIPWAPVFGNHDREGKVKGYDYADIFADYKNCLFCAGYSNIGGVGNYTVLFQDKESIKGAAILMDTHSSVSYGLSTYEYILPEQIAWYKWTIDGLNTLYQAENDESIPTLLFTHIPINEYEDAYEKGTILMGENQEKCCVPYQNSDMFSAIGEKGSTLAVFAGHDHANNSVCLYDGVQLVYGVQSGWCKGYADDCMKGATLATLHGNAVTVEQIPFEA